MNAANPDVTADVHQSVDTEQQVLAFLPKALDGVGLFIDVGANAGGYSRVASRILRNARIVMVEAAPDLARTLAERAPEWEADGGNRITVRHAAVSDRRGTARFYGGTEATIGGLWPSEADTDGVDVPTVLLEDLVDGDEKCLIKIDVEGAEWRVMAGSPGLPHRPGTSFLVELHGFGDRELKKYPLDLLRLFRRAGYSVAWIYPLYYFWKDGGRPAGYAPVLPVILLKYVYRRFLPGLEGVVRWAKARGLLGRM